jgi:hypothetical protein
MKLLSPTRTILAAACALALPSAAFAGGLYVQVYGTDGVSCGASDSPCRTISQAINNAAAGDTIAVGPGRYGNSNNDGDLLDPGDEISGSPTEMIVVDKQLTLVASGGNGSVIISGAGISGLDALVSITASGVTFGQKGKGFLVRDSNSGFGVTVDNSTSDVVVSSNTFLLNVDGDLSVAGTGNEAASNFFSGGIFISGTGNEFQKNTIRDCGGTVTIDGTAHTVAKNRFTAGGAISLSLTSSAIVVQQNEIFGNCGGPAITINGGADHVFSKNTITGRGAPNFYILGGSNLQFLSNVTREGAGGFLDVGGSDHTFIGNVASGHSNSGFQVGMGTPTNITMEKNISIGNAGLGFSFNPMLTLTLTGNSAIGNYGYGIQITGSAVLEGNNIFGNDISGNCGLTQGGSSLATATGNFWGAATGPGADPADNVCGNVAFIDASSPADAAFKVKASKAAPY